MVAAASRPTGPSELLTMGPFPAPRPGEATGTGAAARGGGPMKRSSAPDVGAVAGEGAEVGVPLGASGGRRAGTIGGSGRSGSALT